MDFNWDLKNLNLLWCFLTFFSINGVLVFWGFGVARLIKIQKWRKIFKFHARLRTIMSTLFARLKMGESNISTRDLSLISRMRSRLRNDWCKRNVRDGTTLHSSFYHSCRSQEISASHSSHARDLQNCTAYQRDTCWWLNWVGNATGSACVTGRLM